MCFDTFVNIPPIGYSVSDRRDFFMKLKKHITEEKTGISYMLCGDYYLSDLELPEEKFCERGHFGGRAKFGCLQKYHKALLIPLRTSRYAERISAHRRRAVGRPSLGL